jgi:putative transferase (TIGR04331 family)
MTTSKVGKVNIRASALQEFWTGSYPTSMYLWHNAKHSKPLTEIEGDAVPTHKDILYQQSEIQQGHDFCKLLYYKTLPILAERLNKIHNTRLSLKFWQVAFGKWLYRHIAVLYEKFEYLKRVDIDNTDIKLLAKECFFFPKDHYEYILCFIHDFGTQQLVSLYYYLFAKRQFELVAMPFPKQTIDFCNLSPEEGGDSVEIALLGVFFSREIFETLKTKSAGKIANIAIPTNFTFNQEVNLKARATLSETPEERTFEAYFFHSLYHCMPRDFIENFSVYLEAFDADIERRSFKSIVAEAWISHIPSAIYTGLAQEKKRTFICYEHGAGNVFFPNFPTFVEHDVSDIYLSVGWGETEGRFVKGGFAARDMLKYEFSAQKRKLLYISLTKSPYVIELNEATAPNTTFLREMRLAYNFTERLPGRLRQELVFRPRPKDVFFWDTESTLELERRNIKVERGDFRAAIHSARLIVIDHISTGISELLLSKIPFILLYDFQHTKFEEGVLPIFEKLISSGVLHTTPDSAIAHIEGIYDNVQGWWESPAVQESTTALRDFSLAPASRISDFLLNHLQQYHTNYTPLESELLNKMVSAGEISNASEQFAMANRYLGGRGLPADNQAAAYWMLRAASQGKADAEYRLGWMYETGVGLPINPTRAVYWYSKAAEHGSREACTSLGILYSKGIGVPTNYLEAYVWFKISAKKGETTVIEMEGILEELLTTEQIVAGRRMTDTWLEKHEHIKTVTTI